MNPLDLFIAPSKFFRQLKDRPTWVMSFAALAIIGMVLDWFSFGAALQTSLTQLPQRATPEMVQDAVTYLEGRRFINTLLEPIKLGVASAVFAYVLYLVCSISKPVLTKGRLKANIG